MAADRGKFVDHTISLQMRRVTVANENHLYKENTTKARKHVEQVSRVKTQRRGE